MAIIANGIRVTVANRYLPDSYEKPSYTAVDGQTETLVIEVPRDDVADPDKITTFDNIIEDSTYGIEKQLGDYVDQWYDSTANDVTWYGIFSAITTNVLTNGDSDCYTDTAVKFLCTVTLVVDAEEIILT